MTGRVFNLIFSYSARKSLGASLGARLGGGGVSGGYVVIRWQLYHMVGYLDTRDCDIVQRRGAQGLTKLLAEIKQLPLKLFYGLQEGQDTTNLIVNAEIFHIKVSNQRLY